MKKLPPEVLELFRQAGSNGGKRRKKELSPKRRRQIARAAAKARWKRQRSKTGQTEPSIRKEKG